MIHSLKIKSEYFKKVISGEKTFEVRKNDRDFRRGDILALNEYKNEKHTGRSCLVVVDYILSSSELNGIIKSDSGNEAVIMAIKLCDLTVDITHPGKAVKSLVIYAESHMEDVCTTK